jgi:hypothetical protein
LYSFLPKQLFPTVKRNNRILCALQFTPVNQLHIKKKNTRLPNGLHSTFLTGGFLQALWQTKVIAIAWLQELMCVFHGLSWSSPVCFIVI